MLREKLDRHGASVWLVNTGWTGGPFGAGHRMPITATRGLLHAALSGALDGAEYRIDLVFGFEVPVAVPGCRREAPQPSRDLGRSGAAYDAKAQELAGDVPRQLRGEVRRRTCDPAVAAAGPRL